MKIVYLVRSKKIGGFSIERVFDPIIECVRVDNHVIVASLPFESNSLIKMLINAIYGWWVSLGADVCHMTGDQTYAMTFVSRRKSVITIHDCSFTPGGAFKTFKKWLRLLLHIRIPGWRAGAITVISMATQNELLDILPSSLGKISLIGNAIDGRLKLNGRPFPSCPRILQFGRLDRKNLTRVISALNGLSCHLRIVGSITESQRELLLQSGVMYSQVQNLSDEEMLQEYSLADMLSFPSTYEGFGVPILEAQACGIPVLTSDIEPMRSVAGGGAMLVNPLDVDSIREGFKAIIENNGVRASIVDAGQQNVSGYTAQFISKKYMAVYHSLSKENN